MKKAEIGMIPTSLLIRKFYNSPWRSVSIGQCARISAGVLLSKKPGARSVEPGEIPSVCRVEEHYCKEVEGE